MQGLPPRGPPRITPSEAPLPRFGHPPTLFDIAEYARQLLRSSELREHGHFARTLSVEGELRLMLIGLRAGERIPLHQATKRTTVQTILGHARLHCVGAPHELLPGTVLIFERGTLHELEAVESCALLFSLVWLGDG